MSDLIKAPHIFNSKECLALAPKTHSQKIQTRTTQVGDHVTIRRALPHTNRKTIGAWCFLDHFGPLDLKKTKVPSMSDRIIGTVCE